MLRLKYQLIPLILTVGINSTPSPLNSSEKFLLLAESLVHKFGPLLRLHPEDGSSPASVDWFVKQCALKAKKGGWTKQAPITTVHEKGAVTLSLLSKYQSTEETQYFLDSLQDKKTLAGEGYSEEQFSSATAYVNAVKKANSNGILLQFIFFYPNQEYLSAFKALDPITKFLDIGIHEGDWEHIDIHLKPIPGKPIDEATSYELDKVHFARHQQVMGELKNASEIATVDESLKEKGTHPVVYVAKNSHANYPLPIKFDPKGFDQTSKNGPCWKCWEHALIVTLGDLENPVNNQVWVKYNGRWGSTVEDSYGPVSYHGNSPETAFYSGWFRKKGATTASFDITVNGDEISEIAVSKDTLEKKRASTRYSPYFSLEVPSRIKKLMVSVEPQNSPVNASFKIYVKKIGFTDIQVSETLQFSENKTSAIIPVPDYTNNLYIANMVSTVDTGNFNIKIVGIEE